MPTSIFWRVFQFIVIFVPGMKRFADGVHTENGREKILGLLFLGIFFAGICIALYEFAIGGSSEFGWIVIASSLIVNALDVYGFKFFGLMPGNKNKFFEPDDVHPPKVDKPEEKPVNLPAYDTVSGENRVVPMGGKLVILGHGQPQIQKENHA